MGIDVDAIVLASGSGSTHSGLLTGLRAHDSQARVLGICVRRDRTAQKAKIAQRLADVGRLCGHSDLVSDNDILLNDDYLGAGYGQSTPAMLEATTLLARREGILIDPVYTGKAMSGLIGLVRESFFKPEENVIFLHTGGLAALFAHGDQLVDF